MPHIKDFLATYPDIRLDATLTDATIDLIETGTDVAVRIGELVDSTLVARKLAAQRRVLAATPDYLGGRPALQGPSDLAFHECLAFALQPTGAWYYRSADDPHSEPLEIAVNGHLRANDSEAQRDAALSGLGIALLPTLLVGPDVREQHLVAVLTDWEWLMAPGPDRAIWAVYPPKKSFLPK